MANTTKTAKTKSTKTKATKTTAKAGASARPSARTQAQPPPTAQHPTLREQLQRFMQNEGLSQGSFEVTVPGQVYVVNSQNNPILDERFDPHVVGIEVKKNARAGAK